MKKKIPNSYIIVVIIISILYSILRYNVFKGVPWIDLPLYVFNKSLALSSIILFATYHISKSSKIFELKKCLKDYALIFSILHVTISVILISPEYYSKFYSGLKLNFIGELSMYFGILSLGTILLLVSKNILQEMKNSTKIKTVVINIFFVFVATHTFVMGFNGWLVPSTWPGSLPPISLLSFFVAVFPMLFKLIENNKLK